MSTSALEDVLVYQIRRQSDGLLSTGGRKPTFAPVGKSWRRRADLINHLLPFTGRLSYGDHVWTKQSGLEIVTRQLTATFQSAIPLETLWAEASVRREERNAARSRARRATKSRAQPVDIDDATSLTPAARAAAGADIDFVLADGSGTGMDV